MRDDDKRTLREVHQSEPNPYHDRQNFEPEPTEADFDEEIVELEQESEDLDVGDDFEDESFDMDEGDPDYDTQAARGRSRSDIQEFTEEESDDDPSEDESPRNSDDDDPWGDGIHDTPLTKRYEDMADRDELARRLEDLVADAYDWLGRSEDDDAQEIYDTLLDLSERLGNPPEETARTEGVEMPNERDEADA